MPELPDLQVFAGNLTKKLKGKKIVKITIAPKAKLNVSPASFKKALKNTSLKKIEREGKELYFYFNNKKVMAIHLMLHGKLFLFQKKNEQKHTLAEFYFTDDTGLVLTDYQKKANITLDPAEKEAPDALSSEVNYAFLKKLLSGKR